MSIKRAFLFPGQGSQFVGMGKDLSDAFPESKQTFETVNEALGKDLTQLMFEGPENELNLTENTQPALMAISMAIVNILKARANIHLEEHASYLAGHSLGEYSALTAAGSLDLTSTASLLKTRGRAMQKAVPVGEGSMAAILGLDLSEVQKLAQEASKAAGENFICEAANDNSVGQIVVSGHAQAVQVAIDIASDHGAKKAVILPVSAPFHCGLMAPAAQTMAFALADTNIRPAHIPVVANVTARAVTQPADIRQLLVDQVTGMVRWRESIIWMKEQGVTEMIEIGAGKVLSGLVKRIDRDIETYSVGNVEQIEELIKKLDQA